MISPRKLEAPPQKTSTLLPIIFERNSFIINYLPSI
jgi:hypothetical protein